MKTIYFLLSVLILMWTVTVGFYVSATMDGRVNPVVSQLTITNVSVATNRRSGSIVAGDFVKLRNCVFEGISWYYHPADTNPKLTSVRVVSQFEQGTVIRLPGDQSFDNLYVDLNADNVLKHSYAVVIHDCYGGWLWHTQTRFYDTKSD